eukprot:4645739-Amphidinium_carterae.1
MQQYQEAGPGKDLWRAAELRHAPQELKKQLQRLICHYDNLGCHLPPQWANIVALRPKNNDWTGRPICLTSLIPRLWSRIRSKQYKGWLRENTEPHHAGLGSMPCHRVGLKLSIIHEAAMAQGHSTVCFSLDIRKAFESVCHPDLLVAARRMHYPQQLMLKQLNLYGSWRQ